MPIVVYQGFSIHGNEPSGSNAALLVAYYLAAAESDEVENLLDTVVILFDPSFNPDGLQRFAYWANSNKNSNLNPDPNANTSIDIGKCRAFSIIKIVIIFFGIVQ